MKNCNRFVSVLLCLMLLLSILPAMAFADSKSEKPSETELSQTDNKDDSDKGAEKPADKGEADKDKEKTVTVAEKETHYAEAGSVVFNNGGTVYNNDAVVYNNGGVVYNNLGVCYNNGGTVYANGGEVYNNSGTVYNNGAELFTHDSEEKKEIPEDEKKSEEGEPKDSEKEVPEAEVKEGFYKIELKKDYSDFLELEDSDNKKELYIGKDEELVLKLKPGYLLSSYTLSSGELKDNKDGSLTINNVDEDAVLELKFGLKAPEFSLEKGTYFEDQQLEIKAAEKAHIYYTTDGNKPGKNTKLYTEPIELEDGAVIKAVAIADAMEDSEITELEIGIVDVDVPDFKSVKEDYEDIKPKAIEIENEGSTDAVIKKLYLKGDDADSFKLSSNSGKTVPAGKTEDEQWKINPVSGLEKGEYKVALVVETENGESAEFEIEFKVK